MAFSFPDHVALLHHFLDRRPAIVDTLEATLLNVQGKTLSRSRDRAQFEQRLNACFFGQPGLPPDLSKLQGQLAATHLADGYEPLAVDKYANELDPLELIVRAYLHWETHRWPGKNGRLSYGQTIYYVFMLRQLENLSLRLWDEGNGEADDRLQAMNVLLGRLNASEAPTAFVRDARWLIHTAQSPVTKHLRPYFEVAQHISESFAASDRLELHRAGAVLAGGHLRSQLRYRMWETGASVDDPDILAFTRNSNSMDNALLVRDLVPLLNAYKTACGERDLKARMELADAILQGMSADPDLFLTRLDLLAPYTMVEDLFIERDDNGRARYTNMGETHLALLERHCQLVGELAGRLKEDASAFDPSQHVYSPYGISYGFSVDILGNMAADALLSQPSLGLSLEDTFTSGGNLEDKLARARGWAALPQREGERAHFAHAAEYAEQCFARLTRALDARALRGATPNASTCRDARLFVVPEGVASLTDGHLPPDAVSAQEYCLTTDAPRAASNGATVCPATQLANDRDEARFLASTGTNGQWFCVSKLILTLFTSQGTDALITGVPPAAVDVMRLTCPDQIRT